MQHYCGLVTDRNHQQEIQKTNLKSLIWKDSTINQKGCSQQSRYWRIFLKLYRILLLSFEDVAYFIIGSLRKLSYQFTQEVTFPRKLHCKPKINQDTLTGKSSKGLLRSISAKMLTQYAAILACCLGLKKSRNYAYLTQIQMISSVK